MPRRALLLLTVLVLILHWLLLADLPLGGTGQGTVQSMAFHTRMLQAPIAPPAPEAAPVPPPAVPRPVRKPRPKHRPAPPPAEATTPEPPPTAEPDAPSGEAVPTPPEPSEPAQADGDADATAAAPAAPASAASEPAPAPGGAASAPQAPEAPSMESAGVEISPPGATGAAASTTAPPVRLPPSTRLSFDVVGEVKRFHYNASAELVWRQDGSRYEARQQIKVFLLGSRSQSSVGSITPRGLRPERFGDKARSEQAAHFDFDKHEVIFSANTPRAAIADGAQDRLSVFIQLGAMLAAAPERYPPGTQITLTTVGARSADRWSFTVVGPETLDLPAGSTPTLKLERLPREGQHFEQKAELWLGTALDYLPVRIRLSQSNGDFVDLLLSGHESP
ncbi:MAG: DUF3108 domain-containing protein [Proteobacteria bacterium]|nr:DUF3108 domain-containing protein [Pseudomonadota bacterium]